ncbi:hypothetical protein R1sor_000926 [Riccia sorocarpa]|uniref:CCHC-type domain-containing protein n=1 Tax=Riccia sorocarpa TaxID=122646 RepID=A0ABD3GX38_9MARC
MSELNSEKRPDQAYMDNWRWLKRIRRKVTSAFAKIPDLTVDPGAEDVIVDHHLNLEQQIRIHTRKRRLEDCGVVFCTVDISPSRDAFIQWVYKEVENKVAVQVTHVKVLAPRHYLVILNSMVEMDADLVGGPYYMRRRMIYTTPWEPGFDTHKILAKKLAVWLDLLNVDPMVEDVAHELLETLGTVLQMAGVTESMEGKFANIRGCVLMDVSKPLPTILQVHMNGTMKRFKIRYDLLPNACFICHERGHFAKICPKNAKPQTDGKAAEEEENDGFTEVPGKSKGKGKAVQEQDMNVDNNGEASTSQGTQPQTNPISIPSREPSGATGGNLPDLNATPIPSRASPLGPQSKAQKKNIKKREKKKAAKAKQLESGQSEAKANAPAEHEDSSSSDDEDPKQNRLWQTPEGKKSRGEKKTMDAIPEWTGDSIADPPESINH